MKRNQQGSILIFSLIVLTTLLFSMASLMHSTSTATIVTGNLKFKQASMKEADIGLYQAVKSLAVCGIEPCNKIEDSGYIYFQQLDDSVLLNKLTWSSGNKYVHTVSDVTSSYKVQYIIDRLSDSQLQTNINDHKKVQAHSYGLIIKDTQGSSDASSGSNVIIMPAVFYRITIRVEGPSSSLYIAQATVTIS